MIDVCDVNTFNLMDIYNLFKEVGHNSAGEVAKCGQFLSSIYYHVFVNSFVCFVLNENRFDIMILFDINEWFY